MKAKVTHTTKDDEGEKRKEKEMIRGTEQKKKKGIDGRQRLMRNKKIMKKKWIDK